MIKTLVLATVVAIVFGLMMYGVFTYPASESPSTQRVYESPPSKTLRLLSDCDKWHHRVVKLRARGKLQERHLNDYRDKVLKESESVVLSESERCLEQMRRFHKNVLWGW